jgi:hypothetical protein
MSTGQIVAAAFLLLFTLVATIDGLYFHLYKYRLFERPECLREHHLHTMNAFLFPWTVLLLFVFNSSGLLLWSLIGLTILTLIIEFIDVFEERKSRSHLGGLTSMEYSMHFAMSGLRATYTTIILAQKPLLAWSLSAPLVLHNQGQPEILKILATSVFILGVPVFVLHFYLGRTCEKQICRE